MTTTILARAHSRRWLHVCVALLRIFVGFALVPSGLKKVLGEPFTDPANIGPFHDFLDAFHATGFFYSFVGVMQLVTALLLMTQRYATLGAFFLMPIVTTILVFCWSTRVYPTASVVTLMWLATLALLLWDLDKWRAIIAPARPTKTAPPLTDLGLWGRCGLAILVLYLLTCVLNGGIYRPRGVELDNPAFYVFPLLLLLPIATFVIDRSRFRARGRSTPVHRDDLA